MRYSGRRGLRDGARRYRIPSIPILSAGVGDMHLIQIVTTRYVYTLV